LLTDGLLQGATLETPERVPFRLTQNLVDGFGVTGVEGQWCNYPYCARFQLNSHAGVFRVACELTMQLLRDNKDTLSSVLDAFIHDPLVEWRDAQRKTKHSRVQNPTREGVDLIRLAKTALGVIKEKLDGVYQSSKDGLPQSTKRRLETDHLVQLLIQEATDPENLVSRDESPSATNPDLCPGADVRRVGGMALR
jgi:serine/threonine-protein kinase ATR